MISPRTLNVRGSRHTLAQATLSCPLGTSAVAFMNLDDTGSHQFSSRMETLTLLLNETHVSAASPSLSSRFSRRAGGLHGPRLLRSGLLPGSDLLSRLARPHRRRQPESEFSRPDLVQELLRPRRLPDWPQRQSCGTLGQRLQQQVSHLMNR